MAPLAQVQPILITRKHDANLLEWACIVLGGQAGDASGCVCAPFSPEFDKLESGNRYRRGSTAPAYPSVCLPAPATSVLPRTEHGDFSRLSLVSHSKQFKARYPAAHSFFPQCYPFLIKPSFCYPRFVSFRLPVTFCPLLHAPQYTLHQPPPLACPCPPAIPFLCLGHDYPGEPTLRRIRPRICAKCAHLHPCPDSKTNRSFCVSHHPS